MTLLAVRHRADAELLEQVYATIEARLGDEAFAVDDLAEAVGLSRSSLYRRLGEALDQTPQALLHQARLARAARLLDERASGIGEDNGQAMAPETAARALIDLLCLPEDSRVDLVVLRGR